MCRVFLLLPFILIFRIYIYYLLLIFNKVNQLILSKLTTRTFILLADPPEGKVLHPKLKNKSQAITGTVRGKEVTIYKRLTKDLDVKNINVSFFYFYKNNYAMFT